MAEKRNGYARNGFCFSLSILLQDYICLLIFLYSFLRHHFLLFQKLREHNKDFLNTSIRKMALINFSLYCASHEVIDLFYFI